VADVLVALHARRSYSAIRQFAQDHPDKPLVVILTGTDLYHDIHVDRDAQHSLELATRLVVLQRMGLSELPQLLRAKTRIIYQSTERFRGRVTLPKRSFRVAVIGHLRPEKDPMRTAEAARHLPSTSRIRVLHIGAALTPELEQEALREAKENPRYRWAGVLPHWRARQLLASAHLLSITSAMEGSSNVLCEALTSPTPVVASRISGLVGTLGEDYPGYFPVGDTQALAQVLNRAESDAAFYEQLRVYCAQAAPLVAPEREQQAWHDLLAELT
jgi:putative glycosyltransferase (TIGR04348 family)